MAQTSLGAAAVEKPWRLPRRLAAKVNCDMISAACVGDRQIYPACFIFQNPQFRIFFNQLADRLSRVALHGAYKNKKPLFNGPHDLIINRNLRFCGALNKGAY